MSLNKKGLGKGLGALIAYDSKIDGFGLKELKVNDIEPNLNQPRKKFDESKIEQLAESIKIHGIIQPIIVREEEGLHRIVAGERRWRAARMLGLESVPVVVKELADAQVMEMALIENLQREDLNPIEEANAFNKLIQDYDMTQDKVASVLGKSRSAISNSLRLLDLVDKIKDYVINGDLSSGHARALLAIPDDTIKVEFAEQIIKNELSVRNAEELVRRYLTKKTDTKVKEVNEEVEGLENRLQNILGTKVKFISNNKKGKIMIEYYSNDELNRIIELIGSLEDKKLIIS